MTAPRVIGLEDLAWVGPHYRTEADAGRGYFLLSESFYDKEHNVPLENPSRWLVETLALGHERNRYYSVVHKILQPAVGSFTREEFWDKAVFYHFVQRSIGDGPRIWRDPIFFEESVAQFARVLSEAQPDFLIVLGKALWRFLKGKEVVCESSAWVGTTYVNDKPIRAVATQHPSAFARISDWSTHVLNATRSAS
jgi:hypothetical protein